MSDQVEQGPRLAWKPNYCGEDHWLVDCGAARAEVGRWSRSFEPSDYYYVIRGHSQSHGFRSPVDAMIAAEQKILGLARATLQLLDPQTEERS